MPTALDCFTARKFATCGGVQAFAAHSSAFFASSAQAASHDRCGAAHHGSAPRLSKTPGHLATTRLPMARSTRSTKHTRPVMVSSWTRPYGDDAHSRPTPAALRGQVE